MKLIMINSDTNNQDIFEFDQDWEFTMNLCVGINGDIQLLCFLNTKAQNIFEISKYLNFFLIAQNYLKINNKEKVQCQIYNNQEQLIFDNKLLYCNLDNIILTHDFNNNLITDGIKFYLYFQNNF